MHYLSCHERGRRPVPRISNWHADSHLMRKQSGRFHEKAAASSSDDRFLSPEALSDLLGLPEKTLSAWRTQRKGPLFFRMGVHVRYPKIHLDTWLAECEIEAREWMRS